MSILSMNARLTGQEPLKNLCFADTPHPTMLNFWQWAFSDLKQNNVRGIFSEWLVAQILDLQLETCRASWDAFDLLTPKGKSIEVKSAAYLQSWHEEDSSTSSIIFAGLKGQTWSPKTGYSGLATYNADIYVFCIQICMDARLWDATDINQWRFAYLTKPTLEKLAVKSLSLKRLSSLSALYTATELRQKFIDEGFI